MAYILVAAKAQAVSEGGGRHWTISDTNGTLDTVTSGDLIIFNELVGVALTDYDTLTDSVVIDTVGGHELPVSAVANGGAETAIGVGDWLYYDGTEAEIRVWTHLAALDANDYMVGQAMEALGSGVDDTVISVMLRPVPTLRF